jgi:eukaryotic-like serine/threonine-protein kinase
MSVEIDETTLRWEQLSNFMEAFLMAWESSEEPPPLCSFLPERASDLRAVAAIELIKIDMEHRHARGQFELLEWYCGEYSEILQHGEPPCDLIYEEFHVRKMGGDRLNIHDYYERFPHNKEALKRLLECHDLNVSTSLAAGRPPTQFELGDTVEDFTLLTKLGKGAFASVFLARQQSMQRLVALKISADKGNEPQTLAQLDHPHIVRVYDQRRLPEQRLRLLYMQYAPGGTLHEVIDMVRRTLPADRDGNLLVRCVDASLDKSGFGSAEAPAERRKLAKLTWPELVCRLGIQLAQALDFAHKRGVLHRDVKPANVLLTADCSPKLADFNISFSTQLEGASPAAYFGGSVAYMSPEQLEACNPEHSRTPDSLDGRADLFSLAALLWELLYGVRPFREQELSTHWSTMLVELTRRRNQEPPQTPANVPTNMAPELTKILQRALSATPTDRYSSGEQFAKALVLCLQPASQKLLHFNQISWRSMARSWPMLFTLLVALLPNALAGFFNYCYNYANIIDVYMPIEDRPRLEKAFDVVQKTLNSFYFSLGAIAAWYIIGAVARAVLQSRQPNGLAVESAVKLRIYALQFGSIASWLGIVLWISSGIAFPAGTQLLVPDFPKQENLQSIYLHFFASMTICGLIAAAYPFFGLTFLMTRVFYPALLSAAAGTPADEEALTKLAKRLTPFLFVAAVIPLISLLFVVVVITPQTAVVEQSEQQHILAQVFVIMRNARAVFASLVLAGLAGLAVTYYLYQQIRQDIVALLIAVRPVDVTQLDTESVRVL